MWDTVGDVVFFHYIQWLVLNMPQQRSPTAFMDCFPAYRKMCHSRKIHENFVEEVKATECESMNMNIVTVN